jgi:hypothetical protein
MARATRVDFPGAWYHVLNRGTERGSIFYSNRCYERFIELLSILPQRFGVALHGYALMSNHYHLQLESDPGLLWGRLTTGAPTSLSPAIAGNCGCRRLGDRLEGAS